MKSLLLIITLIFITEKQEFFNLVPEQSKMTIEGTSSIHDWESTVSDFTINGQISDQKITDLIVEVIAESIESGKGIMDKKTYDALQVDDHPNIIFKANTLSIVNNKVTGEGVLTIAGQSKTIPLSAILKSNTDTEMQIEGNVAFKMSEFGIDPPTAMFGSLKTGDEVTIVYDLLMKK